MESVRFGFTNLPEWETDARLIQPPGLVTRTINNVLVPESYSLLSLHNLYSLPLYTPTHPHNTCKGIILSPGIVLHPALFYTRLKGKGSSNDIPVENTAFLVYSQTSLTDPLHRSTTPLFRSLYLAPKSSPITIFYLSKSTTSLNRPPL